MASRPGTWGVSQGGRGTLSVPLVLCPVESFVFLPRGVINIPAALGHCSQMIGEARYFPLWPLVGSC